MLKDTKEASEGRPEQGRYATAMLQDLIRR